eukprot:426146_1
MAFSIILFIIYIYFTSTNSVDINCGSTACSNQQFEFTTGINKVTCHAGGYCTNMVIYNAGQLTVECHDSDVCDGLKVYCGEFDPPGNEFNLADMTKTGVTCLIDCNDAGENTCAGILLSCKGDGVDQCIMQSVDALNLVDSTLQCDIPDTSTCNIDCNEFNFCSNNQILCYAPSTCKCTGNLACFSSSVTIHELTSDPTLMPSKFPTKYPTKSPTKYPTKSPSKSPTKSPITTIPTTSIPTTTAPTTIMPTISPTTSAPVTTAPTNIPTTTIPTTSQPTYIPLLCPLGSTEIGSRDANNDIEGCGLDACELRYDKVTIQECYIYCLSSSQCVAFTWAPIGSEQSHLSENVCTIYDENTPGRDWGPNQIFCIINTASPTTTIPTTVAPTDSGLVIMPSPSAIPTNIPTLSPVVVPETSIENKKEKNENKNNDESVGFDNNTLILIVIVAILVLLCVFIVIMIYKIRKKKNEIFIEKTDTVNTMQTQSIEFAAVDRDIRRVNSNSNGILFDANGNNNNMKNNRIIRQISDNDDNESMYRTSIHNNGINETPMLNKLTTSVGHGEDLNTGGSQMEDGINNVSILDEDTEGESGDKSNDQDDDQINDMYDSKPTHGISQLQMTDGSNI